MVYKDTKIKASSQNKKYYQDWKSNERYTHGDNIVTANLKAMSYSYLSIKENI